MTSSDTTAEAWRGFKPGLWQRDVNIRWFIQRGYTPCEGDGTFLAPATERTKRQGSERMALEHCQAAFKPVLPGIITALILTCLLKETGTASRGPARAG